MLFRSFLIILYFIFPIILFGFIQIHFLSSFFPLRFSPPHNPSMPILPHHPLHLLSLPFHHHHTVHLLTTQHTRQSLFNILSSSPPKSTAWIKDQIGPGLISFIDKVLHCEVVLEVNLVSSSKIKDFRVCVLELLEFMKIAWKWQGNESKGWLLFDPICDEKESISRKGSGPNRKTQVHCPTTDRKTQTQTHISARHEIAERRWSSEVRP